MNRVIFRVLNIVLFLLVAALVGYFSYATFREINAISQEGSGYRLVEGNDFSQKDVICSDASTNPMLSNTLYGKTGCISEGEIRIKQAAVNSSIEKGIFLNGSVFVIGLLGVFLLRHPKLV